MPVDTTRKTRPLPILAHLSRVPRHFSTERLAMLCASAALTPFAWAVSADGRKSQEDELEAEGFVLLRKGLPDGSASRWISAEYIVDAVSLLEREEVSRGRHEEGLKRLREHGLHQDAGHWWQQQRQRLNAGGVDFELTSRTKCSAQVVSDLWAGSAEATDSALARAPVDDSGAYLTALEGLVQRAKDAYPSQVKSLYTALRRALVRTRSPVDFSREAEIAFAEWTAYAKELVAYAELSQSLTLARYPDSFQAARALKRKVQVFVGPPNSGKTYTAFQRLAAASSGTYLAPLRLLALEGRDRLVRAGVACSLLTGEERNLDPNATVVSSTVEMLNSRDAVDVAVIDEAQMLFDTSRGWAWTQALVGAPAREVIVICSAYAVDAVLAVLAACGETASVRHFVRKQHVQVLPAPVKLKDVQAGDALVAFSRRDVLMLRDQVEALGTRVALIYGALPPEVRRRESERFASGEAEVLVATDAIGMGLNLPIRRVLFSTTQKYDGVGDRPLEVTEVHQIAGRAGRFGIQEEGFAGVLATAERTAFKQLAEKLRATPQAPHPFKARVAPNPWHVAEIADTLNLTKLRPVLTAFVQSLSLESEAFEVAELEQMLELAQQLDMFAGALPMPQRFTYAQAPVDLKSAYQVEQFLSWARAHAKTGLAGRPAFTQSVDAHSRLDEMEQALRLCTLWLWLDLRFEGAYGHLPAVLTLREQLNAAIEKRLRSTKPLWGQSRR